MFEPRRLGATGQLPDIGLDDFTLTLWFTPQAGADLLRTPSWRVYVDTGRAEGHVNALLAPRCDFHTFNRTFPGERAAATLVRQRGSIFWYLNFDFDNQDHGTEYDLLPEYYLLAPHVNAVLFPSALAPKTVREIARQEPK